MKIGSVITVAFLSAIVIFGVNQRPGGSFDSLTAQAANNLPQRQKEQKDKKEKAAPARKKQSEDDATIRVDTTLVTVPVVAMDSAGKFVPGLRAEDFRVFEEGVAQEIAFFLSAEEPVTVALMLDVSDSTKSSLEEIKAAAIAFVNQLRPDDQVTVIAFDGGLRELTLATSDRRAIHGAIRSARTGGGTRLYDAVDFVLTRRLSRVNGRKAVILFTDGVDVDSVTPMEKNMRTVEEAGIFIYPIHFKHPQDSNSAMLTGRLPIGGESYRGDQNKAVLYLRGIAKSTGASFYMADDKKSMTKSFASIAEELRRRYDLGYYPTAPAKPGQTVKIKVTVERPKVLVRARASYIYSPPNAEK
ncbi:MAG: VWA domain-containing protein [Blastocatellales bacterium]